MSATRARSEIARRSLSISDTGYVVAKQLIFDLGFPEWNGGVRRVPPAVKAPKRLILSTSRFCSASRAQICQSACAAHREPECAEGRALSLRKGRSLSRLLAIAVATASLRPDGHFVRLARVAKRQSERAAAQKSPWPHRRRAIEIGRATPGVRHTAPQPQQILKRTEFVD